MRRLARTLIVLAVVVIAGGASRAGELDAAELAALIDRHIDTRLNAEQVRAADPADDAEFLRRVYLDLHGFCFSGGSAGGPRPAVGSGEKPGRPAGRRRAGGDPAAAGVPRPPGERRSCCWRCERPKSWGEPGSTALPRAAGARAEATGHRGEGNREAGRPSPPNPAPPASARSACNGRLVSHPMTAVLFRRAGDVY